MNRLITRERGYFTRKNIEENEENKENYPVCVLCDGKNHAVGINEFLIHNCLCIRCTRKKEPICKYCAIRGVIFINFCDCLNSHRFYNLRNFIL